MVPTALVIAVAASAGKATDLLLHAFAIDRRGPSWMLWLVVPAWLVVIAKRRALPQVKAGNVRAAAIVVAALSLVGMSVDAPAFAGTAAAAIAIAILPHQTLRLIQAIRLPTNADLSRRKLPSPRTILLIVLAIGVIVWIGINAANVSIGHDEAVYANKARSWLTDLPDVGFMPTRPVLLPGFGYLALAIHPSLFSLRIVGLLLAIGTLVALYLVGAKLSTPYRAVVAVLVVLTMSTFVDRMAEFLTDISSSGLLLVLAYLVVRTQRDASPRSIIAAAVVALAALYLRYGVISGIGAIAVAGLVTYGWRAWWRYRWDVLGAAAVIVVGLVPHFWYAQRSLGSPFGIIAAAGKSAGQAFPGEGLVDYATWLPTVLAGDLGGVLIVAGAVLTGAMIWRRRVTESQRWTIVFALAAVLQLLVLGASAHGEARFVFFAIMALTLVGIHLLANSFPGYSGVVLLVIASIAAVQVVGTRFTLERAVVGGHERRAPLMAAAKSVGIEPPCTVVGPAPTFNIPPEVGWYTGCEVLGFGQLAKLDRRNPLVILQYPAKPNAAVPGLIGKREVERELFGKPGDADSVEVIRFR